MAHAAATNLYGRTNFGSCIICQTNSAKNITSVSMLLTSNFSMICLFLCLVVNNNCGTQPMRWSKAFLLESGLLLITCWGGESIHGG